MTDILFGSFGISTKEPYTVRRASLVLVLTSMHTSPSHRIKHRNVIYGTVMPLYPLHICTSNIWITVAYFQRFLIILTETQKPMTSFGQR